MTEPSGTLQPPPWGRWDAREPGGEVGKGRKGRQQGFREEQMDCLNDEGDWGRVSFEYGMVYEWGIYSEGSKEGRKGNFG